MTAISNVAVTANAYVNGLLTGVKWASGSLTYSFPSSASLYNPYPSSEPSNGFHAFSAVQQQAIAKILSNYSAVANLQFTQVTESASTQATIRYAETNATSTAETYYPSTMDRGGDSWFNYSNHYYDNPVKGNYAYDLMQHETGHALGLKHPQDVIGSFGLLPSNHDSVAYTVMSYRSYVGGPLSYTLGPTSYPQSLMMDDIQALQTLYGANYATNAGNTVYSWNPTTGVESINGVAQGTLAGDKIFMTVWDGGGIDTYDFSAYTTGVNVDLNPAAWTTTSTTQLAALGGTHVAPGNIANAYLFQGNTASLIENAIGGSGADVLTGNQADNALKGGGGNDSLNGNAGTDTAIYSGASTDYHLTQNSDGSWTIADLRAGSPDGTDHLISIEKLQFSNTTVALNATTTLGPAAPPPTPPSAPLTSGNTAPTITSAAFSVKVTEWGAGSVNEANNVTHTVSASISYSDPDITDQHVASFVAEASGYLGTFKLGTLSDTTDKVPWSFSVADSTINFLTFDQTLTQKYDVTINDGHGGTANQTVTITLVGRNETTTTVAAPVVAGGLAPGSDEPNHVSHHIEQSHISDHASVEPVNHPEVFDWLLL